jgi:uncharacterized protein (DUF2147 family)
MRRRQFVTGALGLSIALGTGPVAAADLPSPIGDWRTIDDRTQNPRAIVQVYEQGGLLYGRVKQILDQHYANAVCQHCSGYAENKPVLGLVIMQGLKPDGAQWDGGTILNPEDGKVYRCRIHLSPGGETLLVRGFIGTPMLGRTQTWQRVAG